ncbi:MAG: hypothetical protein JOS17DRAFT_727581 [Linnemannia elongata]|nr:MAG: hypothetical protein JOS17DRAFT_727581 [Linnemannia elongata]
MFSSLFFFTPLLSFTLSCSYSTPTPTPTLTSFRPPNNPFRAMFVNKRGKGPHSFLRPLHPILLSEQLSLIRYISFSFYCLYSTSHSLYTNVQDGKQNSLSILLSRIHNFWNQPHCECLMLNQQLFLSYKKIKTP